MCAILQPFAFLCLTIVGLNAQIEFTSVLELSDGPVFGSKKEYYGLPYEEFLGIPFAAPPVGSLRWQKPQPVDPWTEPLNATKYSPHCTQFLAYSYPLLGYHAVNGEDCLYANVVVPGGVESNGAVKLPVMVWIYGGSFFFGTGEQYPGHELALHGDIIVVTFNYRLSTLGFLSTGDSVAPGNYGLWDQNAALRWVQQNIETFGGDKNRVTIFGQSAGAASVSHALISPHNEGLFQNAIAISGGATAFWALAYNPLRTAIALGDLMKCDAHSSEELFACLMQEGPHKLDFWGIAMTTLVTGVVANLLPVVDGDYVPVLPAENFQAGAGKDVNLISGSTYHDGAGFVIGKLFGVPGGDGIGVARSNETIWAFAHLMLGGLENPDEVFNAIVNMYPDIYSPDDLVRVQALSKAVTEWWFGSSTNFEARQHYAANGLGNTYQYQFSHRQSFLIGYPEWVTASHIDDLYSVFGEPFQEVLRERYLHHDFDATDNEVKNRIMDYYSNFAHTGNPNEGPFQPQVEWTEYTSAAQNYLSASEQFSMQSFYDDNVVDRYRFWTDVLLDLAVFPSKPTFPPATESQDWDSAMKGRLSFTEEDILKAVEKIKDHVKMTVFSSEAQELIEEKIDEYVKEREMKSSAVKPN